MTSRKDQEQYWVHRDKPYGFVTTKEFSEAMKSFHIGRKLSDELAIPFNKSEGHPAALATKKNGVSKKELFKACMDRQILLMKRNKFVYIFKLAQVQVVYNRYSSSLILISANEVLLLSMVSAYCSCFGNNDVVPTY